MRALQLTKRNSRAEVDVQKLGEAEKASVGDKVALTDSFTSGTSAAPFWRFSSSLAVMSSKTRGCEQTK